MIIRTILATCFSILQHCCTWSPPSGFRHSQLESAWMILVRLCRIRIRPRGRSASFCTTIYRCLHGTTMEFLGKGFPCHVPYVMRHSPASTHKEVCSWIEENIQGCDHEPQSILFIIQWKVWILNHLLGLAYTLPSGLWMVGAAWS